MNSMGPGNSMMNEPSTATIYICSRCGKEQALKPTEIIVCENCQGRIFYKKRLRVASQYEAR